MERISFSSLGLQLSFKLRVPHLLYVCYFSPKAPKTFFAGGCFIESFCESLFFPFSVKTMKYSTLWEKHPRISQILPRFCCFWHLDLCQSPPKKIYLIFLKHKNLFTELPCWHQRMWVLGSIVLPSEILKHQKAFLKPKITFWLFISLFLL